MDEDLALQKWLQRLGVAGKREARELIEAGRVTVDGLVVTRFAEPVAPEAVVAVDGAVVLEGGPRAVILMNKPVKHVTALEDPEGRDALGRYLPADAPRVFPVGRLDFNTEGALLFTNDGALARRLLHPDWHVEKTYHVKLRGHLDEADPGLARMRAGMTIGRETFRPCTVRVLDYRTRATWVEIVLTEGKFRQIRKMCAACRHQIVKLRRVAVGPIALGDLRPRCARPLTPEEIAALDAAVGLA